MSSPQEIAGLEPDREHSAGPSGPGDRPGAAVLTRLRERLFSSTSPIWISLVLLAMVAIFGALRPSEFLGSFDIKSIFTNAAVAMMLAVGMTYVIITAGIDLSVGSVLVLAGVLVGGAMADKVPTLTQREREVLRLLADGLANEEIGNRLGISHETVRTHLRKAMSKLEADTRTQAVAIALRHSIIS